MVEVWKDIDGYKGLYQVSSLGRVRSFPVDTISIKRNSIMILQQYRNNHSGYMMVHLRRNHNRDGKRLYVHRLVATAFLPNPCNLPQVNHKDENKINNVVENLEWCTHIYNTRYGTGLKRRIKSMRDNNGKSVLMYDKDWNLIREYDCLNDVKQDGFHPSSVCRCCKGLTAKGMANGYRWTYKT